MSEVIENQEVQEEKPKAKKTKGLFVIRNPRTGFEHYGVSSQVEIVLRDYFRQLDNGKHSNKKLQAEYDESQGALEHEIIKEFPADTPMKVLYAEKRLFLGKATKKDKELLGIDAEEDPKE